MPGCASRPCVRIPGVPKLSFTTRTLPAGPVWNLRRASAREPPLVTNSSSPSTSVLHSPGSFLYLLSYCPPAPAHIDWAFNRGGFPLTGSERRTNSTLLHAATPYRSWTTGAAVGETSTESRDVSSRGVYFYSPRTSRKAPPSRSLLTLPNEITLPDQFVSVASGRVQRTEPRDEFLCRSRCGNRALRFISARRRR